jgi:hypothetical protein
VSLFCRSWEVDKFLKNIYSCHDYLLHRENSILGIEYTDKKRTMHPWPQL